MTPAESRSANIALFCLWALFWAAMISVSLQEASRNEYIEWWEPLLWEGSSAFVATGWLLAQRRVDVRYAKYLDRPLTWFAQHLKWLPLIAPTFIALIYAIRHAVYRWVGEVYDHDPWAFVVPYETVKLLLFFGLWLGVIFAFDSFSQWRSQRERLLAMQKALAESQLAQLQSQLRPHFLFNALNTISSLMHVDPERADRLLMRLGDLLRIGLQAGSQEITALRAEIHSLGLYAQIMQERFPDRVSLQWDIAQEALDAPVPSFLLQPLLENAFKHGVEKEQGTVHIRIDARRDGQQLWLAIANTGTLDFSQQSAGIGLRNCRERLHVHYGAAAALELRQEGPEVLARVRLPLRRPDA
jgi:Histidine kinase